jgi:Na+/proline symporter
VGVTHKQQMAVMFGGLFVAFGLVVWYLREHIGFVESLQLAGALGKTQVIETSFDPSNKYTLWSGLIGGFFLQLAYFGTDQSQVQRYLSGQNADQAKRGLWMNALLKIPMQFFILLTGVLVFVFYLFNQAPVHWNSANVEAMAAEAQGRGEMQVRNRDDATTQRGRDVTKVTTPDQSTRTVDPMGRPAELHAQHTTNAATITAAANAWVTSHRAGQPTDNEQLTTALAKDTQLREAYRAEVKAALPDAEENDKDYIFITFIMDHLPIGVIGLLLAMIFSAGMSSTSAELSALATTSVVDVVRKERTDVQQVLATKWATVLFGLLALGFAAIFSLFENLIQAVNILGSLFYGTILGIFLVAFFLKRVGGTAVFVAALITQVLVLLHFYLDQYNVFVVDGKDPLELAFLWYNLLSPGILVGLALIFQRLSPAAPKH